MLSNITMYGSDLLPIVIKFEFASNYNKIQHPFKSEN